MDRVRFGIVGVLVVAAVTMATTVGGASATRSKDDLTAKRRSVVSASFDLFLNGNSLPEVHLTG